MSSYKKTSNYIDVETLISLAEAGACDSLSLISSERISLKLEVSQQSAARRIKRLEDKGYIEREVTARGQKIRITAKGKETLKNLYTSLRKIFDICDTSALFISGEVTSGMGEGKYYVSREEYMRQFREKLGFEPYPGTLNIRLITEEDIRLRKALSELEGIAIEGFVHETRTFGDAKCFRCEIEGREGAVVIPVRTHHTLTTLEVIAPEKLRENLQLKDGDIVTLKVLI